MSYWQHGFYSIYIPLTATVWIALAAIGRNGVPDANGTYLNPFVFHAANVLVHVVSALMAFEVIRRFVKPIWPALVGALVVAIHPVQVESVGWVSGTKDLLAGCFTFAAIAAYFAAATRTTERVDSHRNGRRGSSDEAGGSRRGVVRWYMVATLLFVLAMLAKPSAMLTGAIIFVIDVALQRRPLKTVLLWTLPWLVLGGIIAVVARQMQPVDEIGNTMPLWTRPFTVAHSLMFYLGKIAWPASLTVDYGQNPLAVFETGWFDWAWIALLVVIGVALAFWKKSRIPAVGLAVFILAPFHVLGWVPFDFQIYSTTADHYLYAAMLGIGLIVAWIVSQLPSRAATAVVIALLLAMGIRSALQTQVWQNTDTLFQHVLQINPNSWAADTSLAVESKEHGDLQTAADLADQAINIRSQDPLPFLVKGSVFAAKGDFAGAIKAYRRAVDLGPNNAGTLTNLGGALAQVGNKAEALPILRRAVSLDPYNPQAHLNLGTLLFQQDDLAGAEPLLRRAVELAPQDAQAHMNHGAVLLAQGRRPEAAAELQAAYEIRPDLPHLREMVQQLNTP
ncbi:hypothetical protein BH10PLA1_BH10PLA1_04570 [soil metagenome]